MKVVVLAVLLAFAAISCVEKSGSPANDKVHLADVQLKSKPSPQHPLDIRFGDKGTDKVRLIGYDLEHTPVLPDRPFNVTWYWQVESTLGPGWQIFTHGADARGKTQVNLDADRMMRSVYPVDSWQKGEFIKDTQEVTLPKGWASDTVVFYLGFYNDKGRMPITQGPHDNENRAEALRVPVRVGPDPKPLARLVARRTAQPIVVDGKLDEMDWKGAQPSGPLVNTMNGGKGAVDASVRVAYDADNLYIGFVVSDEDLISKFTKNDEHLWEQDCVEVMIDPDGDTKNYFEIQVSPRGVSFDTRY
ncbi:MAG TPA: carbohydrate-binding family 9-like protein, partial [Polyangiales bacterium]|nr:carbohydrate-binding family 9-like protein [Polyangiales bacterium]